LARTRSKRPRLDVWTLQRSSCSFATDTPRTATFCITMKRPSSHLHARVPPSTNEGLSGLASRRVDEYHLVSDPIIASIHYEAFSKHLTSYVETGGLFPISTHPIYPHFSVSEQGDTIPRQRLAKLTPQQFQELCTDVYDELIRRQDNSETINGPGAFCFPFATWTSLTTRSSSLPLSLPPCSSRIPS
jgi:hypothetical protein